MKEEREKKEEELQEQKGENGGADDVHNSLND